MSHVRIQKRGDFDQSLFDNVNAVSNVSFFEDLASSRKTLFRHNPVQRLQLFYWQLAKQSAAFKRDHIATLDECRTAKQVRKRFPKLFFDTGSQ